MIRDEKKRLLVIDDDAHYLIALRDFLVFEGFDVCTADTAERGLETLGEVHVHLVILDMRMPGMGGMGFLERVMTPQGSPRIPVLVMTARSELKKFFETFPVDGFLEKPCEGSRLVAKIREILGVRVRHPAPRPVSSVV
jgi:DNA-binding NtrC family response regulator